MKATLSVTGSLVAAAAGFGALVVGVILDPQRACFAYLAAWTYGVTIVMGALILLMIGHAAKASWMVVTRRITEAVVDALPLFLILFIPVAASLRRLYPWAGDVDALDETLRHAILHKRAYLNPAFFIGRTVFYFAVVIAIGALLRHWSKVNDVRPSVEWTRRMRTLSGGGLPVVGLVVSWAAFDWTMSLEPAWRSTIFGLYDFSGGFVGAIALVCVLERGAQVRGGLPVTADHAQALGRVLFAMVIFWAYMAFSQLLIYWIGNIPDEVSFYAARTRGSWSVVTTVLVVGHFVLPFFALLSRPLKRRPAYLAAVGGWMLVMHWVDTYWMILPVQDVAGVRLRWVDAAALVFVGGVSSAWVTLRHRTAAPLPRQVPELSEGVNYEAAL